VSTLAYFDARGPLWKHGGPRRKPDDNYQQESDERSNAAPFKLVTHAAACDELNKISNGPTIDQPRRPALGYVLKKKNRY